MKLRIAPSIVTLAIAVCAAIGFAGPTSAAILIFDVNMNFDPGSAEGGPGVGTITGTFSINSSNLDLTNIDLTEKTNNGDTFGGAFGTQTFTSLTYGNSSLASDGTGQVNYKFGGDLYLFVSIQSNCCVIDGINVGPSFQFDFAYPQGSAVLPGNFDSITSGTNYLYGTVAPAVATAVPEPATWAMMLVGFGGLGGMVRSRRKQALATA